MIKRKKNPLPINFAVGSFPLTPLGAPRISGLKSQILKPTFSS